MLFRGECLVDPEKQRGGAVGMEGSAKERSPKIIGRGGEPKKISGSPKNKRLNKRK